MFSKHNKTISFSIQPRLHNMITLHYWMTIHNNQCMDIEFYIRMCIRICKSIQFIHSKHIVHGDIKPDNIMIESKMLFTGGQKRHLTWIGLFTPHLVHRTKPVEFFVKQILLPNSRCIFFAVKILLVFCPLLFLGV